MPVVRIDLEVDSSGAAKIKEVGGQLKDLEGKGKSAGGALTSVFQGIGQGIGQELFGALKSVTSGLLGAATAAIAYGGHLKDVEARTGVAVEAQQQLDHAAKLVGLSFNDLVPALGKMQQALVDTPEKFNRLGLSVANIQKMKPEDQFLAIADRIGKIADPAQRSAAAMEIFGKAGTTLLPLLTSNIREAMEEAQRLGLVMSDEVAGAADDLGDSVDTLTAVWDGLIRNFGAAVVTSEPLHRLIKGLTEIVGQFSKMVYDNQTTIRAWIDGAVVAAAHALVEMVNVIEVGMAALKALADIWTYLKVAGLAFVAAWKAQIEVLKNPMNAGKAWDEFKQTMTEVWTDSRKEIADHQKTLDAAVGVSGKVKNAFDQLEKTVAAGVGITHKATEAEKDHAAALAAKAKAAEYTIGIQKEFNRILKEEEEIQKIVAETAGKNRVEAIKVVNKQIEDEYHRNVKVIQDILEKGAEDEAKAAEIEARGMEGRIHLLEISAAKYLTMADAAYTLADAIGGTLGSALAGVGAIFDGLSRHEQQAAENLKNYGTTAMTTAQKVQALAAGIGALISAYQGGKESKSPGKGALQGAAKGAAAGSAFGPYGAIIGGAIGGIAGFLGGKKGQKEELNGLRQEFDALMAQARQAGVVFDHVFNPRNAQQYKQAIDEVKRSLDTQAQSQQALQEALGRYNFTLAEQGPILAAQELDQKFGQIYQDWQLLNAAGVDHNAVMRELGPNVGQYVDAAVAAGTEIPAAMKPIIQDLYEHGQLLHANGEAYTQAEVDGLSYAQTMSQMFQDLIAKVDSLVSAILGIPDKTVNVNVNRHYTTSGDDGGADGDPFTPAAQGFHGLVTGPRLFLAGESGAERVDIGPGGGGGGMSEATAQAMLAELRRMPRTLARATRDAVMTTA